jgi:glycosyltransferase involved in cell wall biosynthesis
MATHNCSAYLRRAIDSILSQSLQDFEFIIVDDASTDGSVDILRKYSDPRIIPVFNAANIGLAKSLNIGLSRVSGMYVARMDADDISLPERLSQQAAYLDSNPEVGVVGACVQEINQQGVLGNIWRIGYPPNKIPALMLFSNCLVHPAVMIRRSAFPAGFYNEAYIYAQDYELWTRMLPSWRLANLPDILLYYRVGNPSNNARKRLLQAAADITIYERQLLNLGVTCTQEDLSVHQLVYSHKYKDIRSDLPRISEWLIRLDSANNQKGVYDSAVFRTVLGEKWFSCCYAATKHGFASWKAYYASPNSDFLKLRFMDAFKFCAKAAVSV